MTGGEAVNRSRTPSGETRRKTRGLNEPRRSGLCFKNCGFGASAQKLQGSAKGLLTGRSVAHKSRLFLETTRQSEGAFKCPGAVVCASLFCGISVFHRLLQTVQKRVLTKIERPHICRPSSETLTWLRGCLRGTVRKPGSALKIAGFAVRCEVLQKAQKRVLTRKTVAHISRHFRRGAHGSADEKKGSGPAV